MSRTGAKGQAGDFKVDAPSSKAVDKLLNELTITTDAAGDRNVRDIKDIGDIKDLNGLKKGFDDLLKDFKLEPSPEEVKTASDDARKRLESQELFNLLPKKDQENLVKMQEAILHGDAKALADIVKQYKDDPKKLEALGQAIEKNMKEMGASVQVDVTQDGKLLIYDKAGKNALEVGPDGKTAVRAVEVYDDGSVHVLEGRQVLRPKPEELAKGLGNGAVFDIEMPKKFGAFPGFEPDLPSDRPEWLLRDSKSQTIHVDRI